MASIKCTTFVVDRKDLHKADVQTHTLSAPQDGEVLVRIIKFGLTANNATYAVFGAAMKYFDFFAAPSDAETWGVIPVWGFGLVEESKHAEVPVGTHIYGYFPTASHIVFAPSDVNPRQFTVKRPHLPADRAVYNNYTFTSNDHLYVKDAEDYTMLFRPLFLTGFFLDDYVADLIAKSDKPDDPPTVLVSSASSKTAMGLGYQATAVRAEYPVTGITSAKNKDFTSKLSYSHVITYDDVKELPQDKSYVMIDIAGSPNLRRQLQEHLGATLLKVVGVGQTHWDNKDAAPKDDISKSLSGKSEFFFAPTWIQKRLKDWGPVKFGTAIGKGFASFIHSKTIRNVQCTEVHGSKNLLTKFEDLVTNKIPPCEGLVVSLSAPSSL